MMQQATYINFNGNIVDSSQPIFTSANRAFRYGDAVFETIRLMNGEILFFEQHLQRLKKSMSLLGMLPHDDLTFHNLYLSIRHLDQVNQLKGHGRIRLEVFRNDGGLYTPQSNHVSYIIEVTPLALRHYKLNDTGLKIELYTDIKKPVSALSNLKSSNALYYVMAGLYKRQHNFGDCLVLNTDGRIAEAISSNIFLVKGNTLITPSLEEACVAGIMRESIIRMMKEREMPVIETGIEVEDMLKADEIFLTDVIHGIRWVSAFRHKRYFNSSSRQLLKEIQELHSTKKV
ncbi:MAG: aminotransferase class IV family protein [Bacteroidetes bacterium]|nr:aminotransferase class IV family protein [Bacteroidota bacterium]MBL0256055.1 aminotransferase class IV family protein [Bacteroidota bacterium]